MFWVRIIPCALCLGILDFHYCYCLGKLVHYFVWGLKGLYRGLLCYLSLHCPCKIDYVLPLVQIRNWKESF